MVTDSLALFCDAGLPAIVSTVITVCYLSIRLSTWFADNFYAIPNKAKRSQVTTATDRDSDSKTTTQKNQSKIQKANRQIVDIKQSQPTMASRLLQNQKEHKQSTSHSNQHIPEAFKNLPYIYQDNGHTMCSLPLNIIHSLKDCPHLQNIRDNCVKEGLEILNLAASEPVTTDILTPHIEHE